MAGVAAKFKRASPRQSGDLHRLQRVARIGIVEVKVRRRKIRLRLVLCHINRRRPRHRWRGVGRCEVDGFIARQSTGRIGACGTNLGLKRRIGADNLIITQLKLNPLAGVLIVTSAPVDKVSVISS